MISPFACSRGWRRRPAQPLVQHPAREQSRSVMPYLSAVDHPITPAPASRRRAQHTIPVHTQHDTAFPPGTVVAPVQRHLDRDRWTKSGRPGSNRRRPAWEATKCPRRKAAEMKRKLINSSTYDESVHSRIIPEKPRNTPKTRNRSGSRSGAVSSRFTARSSCAAPAKRTVRITNKSQRRERARTRPQSRSTLQPTPASQLRNRLTSISEHLGRDELAVLTLIAERLRAGRESYGTLQLATDVRDFAQEALEEAADMAVYAAAGLLKKRRTSFRTKKRWR